MLDLFTGRKVMILDSKNFLPFPLESSFTFDQDNGTFQMYNTYPIHTASSHLASQCCLN